MANEDEQMEGPELTGEQKDRLWKDRTILLWDAIRDHHTKYGSSNWNAVRDKFADVSDSTFWRTVAKIKRGEKNPDPDKLRIAVAAARRAAAMARRVIPAAPSPAIIYSGGADVAKNIDYMTHVRDMLDDIAELRAWSRTEPDENGMTKIKNPMYYAKAISLRGETLDRALKAYESVWDLRKQMDFYDVIIAEISQCAPEVAQVIMDRLNILNNERGLTINARIE